MNSRRDFLKQAAALGAVGVLPASIRRAMAIDPAPGSTWQDAEHVVILMQENRSFDHCFGTLRGVRGFSDPRAITLPDGLPVWLQTNAAGETHVPFPLGLTKTKSTWMQSLPHSWADQTAARREGHHDRWLIAKAPGKKEYRHLPMTLGFYTRDDLPFYYSLADSFTVCDQNFCSSLTGTTPNRLHLWSGTIRAEPHPDSPAALRNSDADYGSEVTWTTFPERLETLGISWRVYQNELSVGTGLSDEEDGWLGNFTDNALEFFTQYGVRFSPAHHVWLKDRAAAQQKLVADAEANNSLAPAALEEARRKLERFQEQVSRWTPEAFAALPPEQQAIHRRAFTTNTGDPDYHKLEKLTYQEAGVSRSMAAPAGDVLHQFREDVRTGKLPAVSWLVAPQHFSDHPESPWYGAWYLAEAFDILTKNPEVWKKTIFILCYDENDGWFDHAPPFTAPVPGRPETGGVSPGLETAAQAEYITEAQEATWRKKNPKGSLAEGPIGLGYRVPLLIASPWSRGGAVCSQVFDHTSILQFLETWLTHKTGKEVREPNINAWRRAVCGDLTSVFQPWAGEPMPLPAPVERNAWLGSLNEAQFKALPATAALNPDELQQVRQNPRSLPRLPRQETGARPSSALPYELSIKSTLSADGTTFSLTFAAGNQRFGKKSAGAAFHVYSPPVPGSPPGLKEIRPRAYTAAARSEVTGTWSRTDFPEGRYHLHAHGPNGFFRSWNIAPNEPFPQVDLAENTPSTSRHKLTITLKIRNQAKPLLLRVEDATYGLPPRTIALQSPGNYENTTAISSDCIHSKGWYDIRLTLLDFPAWELRLAGRMEDGQPSWSDPALGG